MHRFVNEFFTGNAYGAENKFNDLRKKIISKRLSRYDSFIKNRKINGRNIEIYYSDLTELHTQAIVGPTTNDLDLLGYVSSLETQIRKKGGKVIVPSPVSLNTGPRIHWLYCLLKSRTKCHSSWKGWRMDLAAFSTSKFT